MNRSSSERSEGSVRRSIHVVPYFAVRFECITLHSQLRFVNNTVAHAETDALRVQRAVVFFLSIET